jgi:head-tail adaptor
MRWEEIDTGSLREDVTIYRATGTKNTYGELSQVWTTVRCAVKAAIRPAVNRPTESLNLALKQVIARNPTDVIIRFRTDLSVTDQVLWGEQRLNIEAIFDPELGRRRWLILRCVEVQT